MSTTYIQYYESIENVTEEEELWILALHEFMDRAEDIDACPEGLDLTEEEIEDLPIAFESNIFCNEWRLYSEESTNLAILGKVISSFLRKFRPEETFRLTWSEVSTNSLHSGGTLVADKDSWVAIDAETLSTMDISYLAKLNKEMGNPNGQT